MNELNWKELNVNTIFDISYGNKLDMCQMEEMSDGIPFITRTATNNGIGGYVKIVDYAKPYPAGCLTVALGGSIGSTFLQNRDFYTSQNVAVLQPKQKLSNEVLLFIATLIQKESNKRFIAFGRELNRHIKNNFTIKLPTIKQSGIFVADWEMIENYIKESIIPLLPSKSKEIWERKYRNKPIYAADIELHSKEWRDFTYDNIFSIIKGKRLTSYDMETGDYAYIGATDSNNGVTAYIGNTEHIHSGNKITVSYNGSIAEAFYQSDDFWATDDVNVLSLKNHQLNKYIAMFLITLIEKEKYRFNYGRKWKKEIMQQSIIKLPIQSNGSPDWEFMENYIKSLPYSANI